jgi:uncharacterized protein YdhG (YjbR/CyaY superfamily)
MADTAQRTVDAYIAAAPRAAQPLLRQLRQVIKKAAPRAQERISYGMPYYDYHGRLIYFGLHSNHLGLYPVGQTDRYPELKEYVTGKGTMRFPLDRPLPVTLITKLVKERVRQNEAKAR